MSDADEVYLSRTCYKAASEERWRYPLLAGGCGLVLSLLGLLTLLLATAGFILEPEVQAGPSAFLAGFLALGSGLSGGLISRRFYSRRHCWLHLAVVVLSTSAIAVLEVLVLLQLIARRIELKRLKFAWDFLPFTVSYNETAGAGSRVYLVTANLLLCLSLTLLFSVFSCFVALR